MKYAVIDTGYDTAENNMQCDNQLLIDLKEEPILHFYDWLTPSASYGYFLKVNEHIRIDSNKIALAKRPTGGGIVFHLWDLTFSVLIPASHHAYSFNTLENYATINRIVAKAIKNFSSGKLEPTLYAAPSHQSSFFCMTSPVLHDVMIGFKKVAGGAQRKMKHGFLHQGTISLIMPDRDFLEAILIKEKVEQFEGNSYPLFGATMRKNAKNELKNCLIGTFQEN